MGLRCSISLLFSQWQACRLLQPSQDAGRRLPSLQPGVVLLSFLYSQPQGSYLHTLIFPYLQFCVATSLVQCNTHMSPIFPIENLYPKVFPHFSAQPCVLQLPILTLIFSSVDSLPSTESQFSSSRKDKFWTRLYMQNRGDSDGFLSPRQVQFIIVQTVLQCQRCDGRSETALTLSQYCSDGTVT